jgi:hypothetical protein
MPRQIEAEREAVPLAGGAGLYSVCRVHGARGGAPKGNRNALRLLREKFGLGQNAPGMQLGHPLYSSEYVFVPARRLGGRGLLLGGALMHWFGRCLRSIHAGDGGQAAYVNAAELAR